MSQLEVVRLGMDELEAMRSCDLDGLDQETAGLRMGVSRGTVQRLVNSGRAKVLQALLSTAALVIEQGITDENLHTDHGRSGSGSATLPPLR
jgi:predicted DNA-binding protein (UPF0251 family)